MGRIISSKQPRDTLEPKNPNAFQIGKAVATGHFHSSRGHAAPSVRVFYSYSTLFRGDELGHPIKKHKILRLGSTLGMDGEAHLNWDTYSRVHGVANDPRYL